MSKKKCTFAVAKVKRTYHACWKDITDMRAQQWIIRDSLAALYPENDPLREQFIQLWNQQEEIMDRELFSILSNKMIQ